MTQRVHAPTGRSAIVTNANGRSYTGVPGTTQDVPDHDAAILEANGWFVFPGKVGTTANRPTAATGLRVRDLYVDTTVPCVAMWDGTNWRNVISGASV